MNSLLNYGSDDDCDVSGDGFTDVQTLSKNVRPPAAQDDVNYEEVGMDLSEDSDKEPSRKDDDSRREAKYSPKRDRDREDRRRIDKYSRDDDRTVRRRDDRGSDRKDRYKDERDDDKDKDRVEDKRDRYRERDERKDRRDERPSRDSRDDKYGKDSRRDRDKERRRSKSRERRRSRSPRRSRSKSKERGGPRGYSRRYERFRMDRFEKPAEAKEQSNDNSESKDRFFMPGITGRFRDQIEKRKLLWQKGKEQTEAKSNPSTVIQQPVAATVTNKSAKVWESTTFGDDKTSSKFKRLMGIRDTGSSTSSQNPGTEVLKKQEQMFSSMEAQYEVARAATHTMRGVGLGFGSFQR